MPREPSSNHDIKERRRCSNCVALSFNSLPKDCFCVTAVRCLQRVLNDFGFRWLLQCLIQDGIDSPCLLPFSSIGSVVGCFWSFLHFVTCQFRSFSSRCPTFFRAVCLFYVSSWCCVPTIATWILCLSLMSLKLQMKVKQNELIFNNCLRQSTAQWERLPVVKAFGLLRLTLVFFGGVFYNINCRIM